MAAKKKTATKKTATKSVRKAPRRFNAVTGVPNAKSKRVKATAMPGSGKRAAGSKAGALPKGVMFSGPMKLTSGGKSSTTRTSKIKQAAPKTAARAVRSKKAIAGSTARARKAGAFIGGVKTGFSALTRGIVRGTRTKSGGIKRNG